MNTPAHLILGAAAFGRGDRPGVTWAALAGAAAPDLSLYAMAGVSIWGLGIPPRRVFDELYFSDAWQTVFAVDNSVFVWGALLALALAWRRAGLIAFAAAALLHIACDLPLHNDDARRHLWPLSDWVFVSPVSYWDRAYHAGIVGPIEVALALALAAWCIVRFRQPALRATIAALAAAELATSGFWRLLL